MMILYDLLQDSLKRYCLLDYYYEGSLALNLPHIVEPPLVAAEPFASVSFNTRYTSSYEKINYQVSLASLSATASLMDLNILSRPI
jgi:hypothetical protein